MRFNFNYRNEKIFLDVKVCNNLFSRFFGLMFRRNSKPLLFIFGKSVREPIHSFFCRPFFAIWFDGSEIVDSKFVSSWRFLIKPKKEFNKLLEIPLNNKSFHLFIDDNGNI